MSPSKKASDIKKTPAKAKKEGATKKAKAAPKRNKKTSTHGDHGPKSDADTQTAIYDALADMHAFGVDEVSALYVAGYAGYKSTDTKSYRNIVKRMKDAGVIRTGPNNTLALTDNARLSLVTKPMNNAEKLERLKAVVGKIAPGTKACEICDILSDGHARSREALAHRLNLTSTDTKSFRDAVSALKKLKSLEVNQNKTLQLATSVFPEGRPDATIG